MPWLWSYNKIDKNSGIYSGQDKLGEGPCYPQFDQMKRCAYERGLGSAPNMQQVRACPAQADMLIQCMKQNPKYFHGKQQQQQQRQKQQQQRQKQQQQQEQQQQVEQQPQSNDDDINEKPS
jgi:hypothetical protein